MNGPVQVTGSVLGSRRTGAYTHLTLHAPGVPERSRPGSFVNVRVGGEMSERVLPRSFPIYRAHEGGASGGTVEVVLDTGEPGARWMAAVPLGTKLPVVGPLGRPFTLPREPVVCTLVGEGEHSAPLFALADGLEERGCEVHMLLTADTGSRLFGVLDAKRTARSLVVSTDDGSAGVRGDFQGLLGGLLARTRTAVAYASGSPALLHRAAHAARDEGAWSQTAFVGPMPCGTGVCGACLVPVVGDDGLPAAQRACVEGPVFRGDRVAWKRCTAGLLEALS